MIQMEFQYNIKTIYNEKGLLIIIKRLYNFYHMASVIKFLRFRGFETLLRMIKKFMSVSQEFLYSRILITK